VSHAAPLDWLATLAYANDAPLVGASLLDTVYKLKPSWLLVVRTSVKFRPVRVSNVRPERGSVVRLAVVGNNTFDNVLAGDTEVKGAPLKPSAVNTSTNIVARLGPPDTTDIASVSCVREYWPGPHVGSASTTLNAMP
jgi:hypothetical protein